MTIKGHRQFLLIALLVVMASVTPAWCQALREEATLFDKPSGTPSAAKLKAGVAVKVLKREGFWVEVDVAGKAGWLKVSQINFAGASGGPTAIDTGRLGTGNIVATSAARGLSAKDLVSGQANYAEANRLELLTTQSPTVQAFLTSGGVVAIKDKVQLAAVKPSPASTVQSSTAGANASGDRPNSKKKGDDDW